MKQQFLAFLTAAAAAAVSLALATPVHAVVELAKPADSFVDSIGVNTHYGNSIYVGGNAYANPAIDAKLAELGVRHLRDHTWNDTGLARIDGLYSSYAVRTHLILGETTRSPADLVNLLKAHPAYEGIEGLNEPDFNTRSWNGFTDNPATNSYGGTRAFQNELYAAVKADPLTQDRTILSPAMGNSARSQYLAPISFDVASLHSYPSGREPTFNLDTQIANMSTLRGTAPAKPLMSTETGYYNEPAAEDGSIPEHIAGKYMPRLFAEYFNRGVQRTYSYELADQGPDLTQREQNFGLLRYDLTEKPAFTAIENLIDLVEEPDAPDGFTPSSLDYAINSTDVALHHTLLQKSDGTFYLMLWQERPGFNRFANGGLGSDIDVAPLPITLTLGTDVALARVFFPNDSALPAAMYANPDLLNLNVLDKMMVVALTPVPEPASSVMLPAAAGALLLRRRRRQRRRDS